MQEHPLGLIAGEGRLPVLVAQGMRAAGARVSKRVRANSTGVRFFIIGSPSSRAAIWSSCGLYGCPPTGVANCGAAERGFLGLWTSRDPAGFSRPVCMV